jgi:hypothetical protein
MLSLRVSPITLSRVFGWSKTPISSPWKLVSGRWSA